MKESEKKVPLVGCEGFPYKGIRLRHELYSVPMIQEIVKDFNPGLIIEFGCQYGGLTLALNDIVPDAEIFAYDINIDDRYFIKEKIVIPDKIHFKQMNLLENYPIKEIVNLCEDRRRKFLYCDNGSKKFELKYGQFLNSNDMIGCHDWGVELAEGDVVNTLKDFKPFKHDIFYKNGFRTRLWLKR